LPAVLRRQGQLAALGVKRTPATRGAGEGSALRNLSDLQLQEILEAGRTFLVGPKSRAALSGNAGVRILEQAEKVVKELGLEVDRTLFRKTIPGRRASGGAIFGPGGSKSDRIPILASNGEFVVNADTVRRLGLPFMEALNRGALPGFQDGGEVTVSPGRQGSTSFNVQVNTQEISSAISDAIITAFDRVDLSFDSEGVVNSITDAISTAFASIELPTIEIDTENISVPLDIPANGIPIDASALQDLDLGNNLGAAVRNRLEAVEGSVESLREDANTVLDTLESIDTNTLSSLPAEFESLRRDLVPLDSRVDVVESLVANQRTEILNEVFTLVNEQINNLQFSDNISSRLENFRAETAATFANVNNSIASAVDIANRALSQALARL